jgi:predicted metal-binding membrane protein
MRIELLSRLIRHRRAVVLGALVAVIAAAWAYLLLGAAVETEMMDIGGGRIMAMLPEWSPPYAVLIFVMWVVMMVAMMLPSAAPTVLLVTTLAWDRLDNSSLIPATALLFASGYLLVWCGFSLAATSLQWGLDEAGLLSERMALGNAILVSTVLIAAGVYQWTTLKDIPASGIVARPPSSWSVIGDPARWARFEPGFATGSFASAAAGC